MRFCQSFLLALTLMLVVSTSVLSAEKNDAVLESISFHGNSQKEESINFKLKGEHAPKIFFIQGENPRIVLDFIDTRCLPAVKRNLDTKGNLTKKIRVGIHDGQNSKTRVVVDLDPNGRYQYTQNFNTQDNTLVLTISRVNTDAALMEKEQEEIKAKPVEEPDAEKSAQSIQNEKIKPPVVAEKRKTVEKKTKAIKAEKTTLNKTAEKKGAEPKYPPANVSAPEKAETPPIPTGTVDSESPSSAKKVIEPAKQTPDGTAEKAPTEGVSAPPESKSDMPEVIGEKKIVVEKENKDVPKKEAPETKSAGKKLEPLLSDVTFEKTTTKGEMILFKLNGFFPPKIVGVEKDKPMVVCDFPNTLLGDKVKGLIRCHGKFVESIQITKQKKQNNIRVVLNLVPSSDYDLKQVFFKEDNLFVIFINTQNPSSEGKTTTSL